MGGCISAIGREIEREIERPKNRPKPVNVPASTNTDSDIHMVTMMQMIVSHDCDHNSHDHNSNDCNN